MYHNLKSLHTRRRRSSDQYRMKEGSQYRMTATNNYAQIVSTRAADKVMQSAYRRRRRSSIQYPIRDYSPKYLFALSQRPSEQFDCQDSN